MIAQLVDVFIYLFIWSWAAASALSTQRAILPKPHYPQA
jgi:hypothetical protein